MRPLVRLRFVLLSTPETVPMVSKTSRKKIDTTHTNISIENMSSLHSICINRGAGDSGIVITSSKRVNPKGMPIIMEAMMLKKIAPFTL